MTVAHHRRFRPHVLLDVTLGIVDPRPTPEDVVVASEDERMLRRALAALTADQRAVVELRLAGLSGSEVAATLGCGVSWVNVTHFRAVSRLRASLGSVSTGG